MARCDHAPMAWRQAGKGSDILVSSQVKPSPWRRSVAGPQAIFTRERPSQLCFSCVLYNRSLRVQLFWSRPHILPAKAGVDRIYGVVWGSMLSNVGWNHWGEASGPNSADLISMEDWINSPQTAGLGRGYSIAKNETTKFFSFIVPGISDQSCEGLRIRRLKGLLGGSTFWKWTWRVALDILNIVRGKGNRDNMNEWNRLGYCSTELLWMFIKLKEIAFHAQQHRQQPSPKPSQQDGKSKVTEAKKQYVTNNG